MRTERDGAADRQRFDVADAALVLLDGSGTVTSWSRDAERLLGHSAADVLGRNVVDLLVPDDAARVVPSALAQRDRGGWSGIVSGRHRDGHHVRVMVRAVPLHRAAGSGTETGTGHEAGAGTGGAAVPGPAARRHAPVDEWTASGHGDGRTARGPGRTGDRGGRTGPLPGGPHGSGLPDRTGNGPGDEVWVVLLSEMADARGWDMSRVVLENMVVRSPVGMAIVDTDLRFVWSNEALEAFGGGPAHERIGRRLADVQPGIDAPRVEAQMRQVLRTGRAILDYEHVARLRSAPHRETAHSLSFTRLDDDVGRPLGVYYTVMDVSERRRARMRLALLDRAGEQIGRTLDVARTAQELADVAVTGLADFVAVDLLESVLKGADPGPVRGADAVPLRRAGHQSMHEGVPETDVEVGALTPYLPGSPPVRTLVDGVSWYRLRLDAPTEEWSATLPGGDEATFHDLGLHSVMIVPIRARGITLGITTFFRGRRCQDPFDNEDLNLAEELVARAAVCVDNARRYTRERAAALVLQRSLLPRRLPEQDAAEVAARYRPADELTGLGGDWYDVIPLSGARVALVVGEVRGHGIDGAAAMGRLRTAVRTLAELDLPPDEVLAHLDDLVATAARQEGTDPASGSASTLGAQCLYVVHDPVSGQCAMASAGHPAPALVAPDVTVSCAELPSGPPLGLSGPPFETVTRELPDGTVLALYTDGLLAGSSQETLCRTLAATAPATPSTGPSPISKPAPAPSPSPSPFPVSGPSSAAAVLGTFGVLAADGGAAPSALDRRARAVVGALAPSRPHDDVVLMLARTRRLARDRVASWDLPADPATVADARRSATGQLLRWGLEDLEFTTELVVSELVTNAIRHSSGPIRLRLILDRALICEVFDGGATAPHLRHPRTTDEGGRGLLLISQVTQRWGTRFLPEGKVIWAEQSLPAPAAPPGGPGRAPRGVSGT